MDILNLAHDVLNISSGVINGIGDQVLIWSIGGILSVFVANEIRVFLSNLSDQVIRKIRGEISTIEDENLREAAKCVVRYVATALPDATDDERIQLAIRKLQDITPDILVSDDKLRVLLESAYLDFKKNLKQI